MMVDRTDIGHLLKIRKSATSLRHSLGISDTMHSTAFGDVGVDRALSWAMR